MNRAYVRAEREKEWLAQNRAAIEAYNRRVAEHGLLSDDGNWETTRLDRLERDKIIAALDLLFTGI